MKQSLFELLKITEFIRDTSPVHEYRKIFKQLIIPYILDTQEFDGVREVIVRDFPVIERDGKPIVAENYLFDKDDVIEFNNIVELHDIFLFNGSLIIRAFPDSIKLIKNKN